VFVGLSGSALRSGQTARRRGIRYVCDRGSSHIRVQDQLLREESDLWGIPFEGVDPRVIDLEEAEYAEADGITVPSSFSLRTFIDQGVAASKLHLLPYGVNLDLFKPTGQPDDTRFDVLYAGGMNLNKELVHARKSLTFAGTPAIDFIAAMKRHDLWSDDIQILGHVPQPQLKDIMSRSHVLVLASVQEGFGMVQAQAMACGCVVIGSNNTGAQDLFDDEQEGFIVPVRNHAAIAARLQQLADSPSLRASMSSKALKRVQRAGGWRDYGDQAMAIYQQLKRS
jgi:alpha-maltose-1-phosphate synthase